MNTEALREVEETLRFLEKDIEAIGYSRRFSPTFAGLTYNLRVMRSKPSAYRLCRAIYCLGRLAGIAETTASRFPKHRNFFLNTQQVANTSATKLIQLFPS